LLLRTPLFVLALSACPALVRADVVNIVANHDNTLYQTTDGSTSNGAGVYLFVGQTNTSGTRRAVLSFDLASAIPAGATITDVKLQMFMTRTRAGTVPIGIHRVQDSWGEGTSNPGSPGGVGAPATTGDATWLHRFFDTTTWNTPGGDFDAGEVSTLPIANIGSYTWPSTPSFVALAQSWLDTPAQNFGVLLLADESIIPGAKRFASRENTTVSQRPTLIVQYIPAPASLLALAPILVARRRRAR
jgi:hypothetical protein